MLNHVGSQMQRKWVHDFPVENETVVCDRVVHASVGATHAYVVPSAALLHLMAVDRGQRDFLVIDNEARADISRGGQPDFFSAGPAEPCHQTDAARRRKLSTLPLISFDTGKKTPTQCPGQPQRTALAMAV